MSTVMRFAANTVATRTLSRRLVFAYTIVALCMAPTLLNLRQQPQLSMLSLPVKLQYSILGNNRKLQETNTSSQRGSIPDRHMKSGQVISPDPNTEKAKRIKASINPEAWRVSKHVMRRLRRFVQYNITTASALSQHPYFTHNRAKKSEVVSMSSSSIDHNAVSFPECAHVSQPPNPLLLILVLSRPGSSNVRDAIRNQWGSTAITKTAPSRVRVAFLLGNLSTTSAALQAEIAEYGDLLVGDFHDTYRNLLSKVRFGLEWALDHCPQAEWIVKIDDDRLVHVPLLSAFLLAHGQKNSLYGQVHETYNVPVNRDTHHKWFVSKDEYPLDFFPSYADGPCYVLSRDAAQSIINIWGILPPLHLEDVYITGMLGDLAGVRKVCIDFFWTSTTMTFSRFRGAQHWLTAPYRDWFQAAR